MFVLQSDRATERQSVKSKNKSFTLLEIVFTIVIIGVLLAIFLPVMSSVKLAAQKVKDQSNLKTIAAAWKTYVIDNNFGMISFHGNAMEFPCYLSGGSVTAEEWWQGKERCILTDPYVYISPGDKYAAKVLKGAICSPGGNHTAYLDPYSRAKNDLTTSSSSITLSYCTIPGLPTSVPLATTPIAFTRGLKDNGKWHSKYGLYGDKGGYVAYCDGHVVWFDGSRPAQFLKWNQSGYTNDIREAIPTSAFISSGQWMYNNIRDTDNSLLLIYHAGIGVD
jgi:prepilin-type processing-associated H-X9-DG protein